MQHCCNFFQSIPSLSTEAIFASLQSLVVPKHLSDVETRFPCLQAFVLFDFQCRDDVSWIESRHFWVEKSIDSMQTCPARTWLIMKTTKKSPKSKIAKTIILTCDVARLLPSRVHVTWTWLIMSWKENLLLSSSLSLSSSLYLLLSLLSSSLLLLLFIIVPMQGTRFTLLWHWLMLISSPWSIRQFWIQIPSVTMKFLN